MWTTTHARHRGNDRSRCRLVGKCDATLAAAFTTWTTTHAPRPGSGRIPNGWRVSSIGAVSDGTWSRKATSGSSTHTRSRRIRRTRLINHIRPTPTTTLLLQRRCRRPLPIPVPLLHRLHLLTLALLLPRQVVF